MDEMELYIGTKLINAKPMNRAAYNALRGWAVPEDEKPEDKGYLVEYLDSPNPNVPGFDNYVSWSPKDVFERSYRKTGDGLTFGETIEALKIGKRVAREGWNGKGMFLFMRPPDELTPSFIADKVKSLPNSVKQWAEEWANEETHYASGDEIKIKFTEYICMKASDNTIVNGWLASQTDMLSEDWIILD